ncbi:MAG: tRNA (5-methylaminomethyl-2-thiouridine)(34)-methyltransferase MnmD, partial [Quisquiliibacterium sp.]
MLSLDCNQHPRNDLYGDVYKSRFGAVEEAHHVFVQGAGLPERFAQNKSCTIVELGFGLGVNFLATQRAWRNTPSPRSRLHFVSIEKHPLDAHQIKVAHAALGLDDEDARALRAVWPTPTPGMHRLDFDDGSVTLMVAHGDLHDILPKLRLRADAIFLDGFSPRCNPDMWSLRAMKALGRLASNDARLATYSSSRLVRDNLAASGFEVTLKPGFGAKHRRIEARHAPRWTAPSSTQPIAQAPERRVIIVGAGLAGCAIAERLARSGWQVTLLERSSSIGGQAATQPAIADHLHLSPDDNPTARLTRAALLLDRDSQWPAMQHVGRLELAANAQQALTKQACAEKLAFPEQLLRYVDSQEANRLTGPLSALMQLPPD